MASEGEAAPWLALARHFERGGMLAEAAECYERIVWAGVRDRTLYARLAAVYRQQGRDDLADALVGPARGAPAAVAEAACPPRGRHAAPTSAPARPVPRGRTPAQGSGAAEPRLAVWLALVLGAVAALRARMTRAWEGLATVRAPWPTGVPALWPTEVWAAWLPGVLAAIAVATGWPGRLWSRWVRRMKAANTRARPVIATDDLKAGARYLASLTATWVRAIQAGSRRWLVRTISSGDELRVVRSSAPDHVGSAWRGLGNRASRGAGPAAPGQAVREALVLAVSGLVVVAIVSVIADALGSRVVVGNAELAGDPTAAAMSVEDPDAPREAAADAPGTPAQPDRVQVASTGGQGANLRLEPGARTARAKAIREGAVLEVVGPERAAEGRTWRQLRDPTDGLSGWVAAEFLVVAPP